VNDYNKIIALLVILRFIFGTCNKAVKRRVKIEVIHEVDLKKHDALTHFCLFNITVHLKLKERQTEVPRKMLDLFYKRLLLNLRSDLMEKGIQPLETDYLLYVRSYLATTYSYWAGNDYNVNNCVFLSGFEMSS